MQVVRTDREKINLVARAIAATDGWEATPGFDFVAQDRRSNPRGYRYRKMAEAAWLQIHGRHPDYLEEAVQACR
jgi:hypothetical protein